MSKSPEAKPDTITLTRQELQEIEHRVLTSKAHPTLEWTMGVRAAFAALWQRVPNTVSSGLRPVPGMVVKCKGRPFLLKVRKVFVEEFDSGPTTLVDVDVIADAPRKECCREGEEHRRRRFKLSTWKQWVKNGVVLEAGRWAD